MKYNFNTEEMNLLAAFDAGNRTATIEQMEEMVSQLGGLLFRLHHMTDEAYNNLEIIVTDSMEDFVVDE